MLRLFKKSTGSIFLNFRKMMILHIFFSAAASFFSYIVFQWVLKLTLSWAGYSYLTPSNLLRFIITLPGVVCFGFTIIMLIILLYIRIRILLTGFQASMAGCRITIRQLLFHSFHTAFRTFKLKYLYVVIPVVCCHIVSMIFFLYQLCFRINPFSTFLPNLFSKKLYIAGIAAFLLILFLIGLFQFLAPCCILLGKHTVKKSIHESPKLLKKHSLIILRDLIIANLVIIAGWFVLKLLCQLIAVIAVNFLAPNDVKVAMILNLNNTLSLALIWLASAAGLFFNLSIAVRLYYRFSNQDATLDFQLYTPKLHPQRQRMIIAAFVAAVIALSVSLYNAAYHSAVLSEHLLYPTYIISHRGLSSAAPENTIPAVELAIEALSDAVEIDVQETKDGVVVVTHDSDMYRLCRSRNKISNMTYEELLEYDVGSAFSDEYAGTTVPTLEQVLEVSKGKIDLVIELKRNPASDDLPEKVVAMLEEYDMINDCYIQSPDYAYLKKVRELNPDITIGYILTAAVGSYYINDLPDFFCVRSMFVSDSIVSKAHERGKAIFSWTVNTRAEIERMKKAQVDAIITDYPAKTREVIYREEGSETILKLLRLLLKL